ncbi:MAG TPA: bifunctional diguanylate cyclase/phosphodiesterase [Pseudogracilibacillus sp.]|nr:bifunctional diguanylate cyclase/phosphodiesterase [Pseudogracilibacillus sp.]
MYLDGSYNYSIVSLSIVIAIAISYVSLNIASRTGDTFSRQRVFWLALGSMIMGVGVWAFHFIGMIAFNINIPVSYDLSLTLISLLASVAGSFIAFYITSSTNIKKRMVILGGVFLASGIVSMHYLGMKAMIMPATVEYDVELFILSIFIAFIASYGALFLFISFQAKHSVTLLKIISAIVMGGAISGMHYTGMAAASFYIDSEAVIEPHTLDTMLLYGIILSVVLLLIISWIALYYDRVSLEKMAFKDPLTNLGNRHKMNRVFVQMIHKESIGVLFIDLVQFKLINDTLGHHSGDLVIQQVAKRLKKFAETRIKPFRIGGDEFLFIISDTSVSELNRVAEQLSVALQQPYVVKNSENKLKINIGMSYGKVSEQNTLELLEEATMAMHYAKKNGDNQPVLYSDDIGGEILRRNQLIADLQTAIEQDEFFIMYQPKWHIDKQEIHGFEALLRWKHPQFGLISPAEFIPIAEDTGAIVPITYKIIEEVSEQILKWEKLAMKKPISVNLSTRIFQTDDFVKNVKQILEKTKVNPQYLEFEITESMVFHDVEEVTYQLEHIRLLGVHVSMDDFGVGYSSIGLLDRIPLDTLKLDRLFTKNLDRESKQAIVKAILLMAKTLKLDVIAEGVETKKQLDLLEMLGCKIIQGYYFYKPYDVSAINEWLLAGKLDTELGK